MSLAMTCSRSARSVMLMLVLLLLVNGCVGQSPAASTPDSPAGRVSFMIFGDPAEKQAYENLVAAFERAHPRIDIELIHIPGQTEYRRRLAADFAAGTPADVVLLNYRRHAALSARGALEPLDSYLASSTTIKEADFYGEALEPFKWQGKLMCIPQNLSSLVVYYNKDLFEQSGVSFPDAGWDWDAFLQTAIQLTKDTDGDGGIDQYGLGVESVLFRVTPFVWQNGGDLVDNPTAPTQLWLDKPQAAEAVQWFVDLQVKHHVVPDRVQEEAENSENRFENGRLAMYLNSRRGVPTYREAAKFDWDVAPLPRGRQPAGILHSDGYCMPASNKNKAATWAFIEFANSPEGQEIVARSGRTVPSLKAVAESSAFLNPDQPPRNSRVFLDIIPYIRSVPVLESWVDIEEIVDDEITRAFYGDVSTAEALRTAAVRTREYFRR